MFDIGFSELVLIALVALIVLGPQRLPEVARTAGRWAGQARRFMDSVKSDLDRELATPELEQFRKLQQDLSETRTLIEAPLDTLVEPERPVEPTADLLLPADTKPASAEGAPKPAPKPKARKSSARPKSTTARKKHAGPRKRTAD